MCYIKGSVKGYIKLYQSYMYVSPVSPLVTSRALPLDVAKMAVDLITNEGRVASQFLNSNDAILPAVCVYIRLFSTFFQLTGRLS